VSATEDSLFYVALLLLLLLQPLHADKFLCSKL